MKLLLKPCPFCGKIPWLRRGTMGGWAITCINKNCGLSVSAWDDDKEKVVKEWNIRKRRG